jgi:hypothetical protein
MICRPSSVNVKMKTVSATVPARVAARDAETLAWLNEAHR